jgi:hypothetical protein
MVRACFGFSLALLVGATACSPSTHDGGSSATSADAGRDTLDACPLLDPGAIAEVLGESPGPPERTPGKFAATCKWPSADGRTPELVHVLITTGAAVASFEDYDRRGRAAMKGRFADTPIQPVAGFGDFAVWAGDDASGALQVFEGGRLVQVTVARVGDRPALDVARALMGRVKK